MKALARAIGIVTFLILMPVSALWATVAAYVAPLWVDLLDAAWVALNLVCLGILTFPAHTKGEKKE